MDTAPVHLQLNPPAGMPCHACLATLAAILRTGSRAEAGDSLVFVPPSRQGVVRGWCLYYLHVTAHRAPDPDHAKQGGGGRGPVIEHVMCCTWQYTKLKAYTQPFCVGSHCEQLHLTS